MDKGAWIFVIDDDRSARKGPTEGENVAGQTVELQVRSKDVIVGAATVTGPIMMKAKRNNKGYAMVGTRRVWPLKTSYVFISIRS